VPQRDAAIDTKVIDEVEKAYDDLEFSRALDKVWGLITWLDGYIVKEQPWKLAKQTDEGAQEKLDNVLWTSAQTLQLITALVYPAIPDSARNIWRLLGMESKIEDVKFDQLRKGEIPPVHQVQGVTPLFPRIEAKPAIEKMQQLELEETRRQAALFGKVAQASTPVSALAPEITIDDFVKIDLRVGEVKSAELVKGADKLLHLKVDIGEPEPRTIVAGIAKAYEPAQLLGRKVVIVANLAPRKLRGLESRGMIVAASLEDTPPVLASFLEEVPIGARLK
jgi:methionyl-tRNA synthetase